MTESRTLRPGPSEHAIEVSDNTFVVDASLIGELLHLPVTQVAALMREGRITSACERGADEHEGEFRLTFFSEPPGAAKHGSGGPHPSQIGDRFRRPAHPGCPAPGGRLTNMRPATGERRWPTLIPRKTSTCSGLESRRCRGTVACKQKSIADAASIRYIANTAF